MSSKFWNGRSHVKSRKRRRMRAFSSLESVRMISGAGPPEEPWSISRKTGLLCQLLQYLLHSSDDVEIPDGLQEVAVYPKLYSIRGHEDDIRIALVVLILVFVV
jgi:hypothetical protein